MTKTNKRYLAVSEPTVQSATVLQDKGFIELPDAVRPENTDETKLIVDTKLRNFWKADNTSINQTRNIVYKEQNEYLHEIESKELINHL